jgi:hypothetical protein
MATRTRLPDLVDAYEWRSSDHEGSRSAQANRLTGEVRLIPGDFDVDFDEELPDDVDDDATWASVPDERDLDLGRRLAMRYAEERLPDDLDRVGQYFSRQGAYARFKDLLELRGRLDDWYAFEREATERALRRWAQDQGFDVVD